MIVVLDLDVWGGCELDEYNDLDFIYDPDCASQWRDEIMEGFDEDLRNN
jgi:hypothetical protein